MSLKSYWRNLPRITSVELETTETVYPRSELEVMPGRRLVCPYCRKPLGWVAEIETPAIQRYECVNNHSVLVDVFK